MPEHLSKQLIRTHDSLHADFHPFSACLSRSLAEDCADGCATAQRFESGR